MQGGPIISRRRDGIRGGVVVSRFCATTFIVSDKRSLRAISPGEGLPRSIGREGIAAVISVSQPLHTSRGVEFAAECNFSS
jgi:hypothetical protein